MHAPDSDPSSPPRPKSTPPHVLRWPLQWGVAGFLAGFVGPIVLDPSANQGPLLGIFITGPGGAALGLFAGLVATAVWRRNPPLLRRVLFVSSLVVAAAVLALVAASDF